MEGIMVLSPFHQFVQESPFHPLKPERLEMVIENPDGITLCKYIGVNRKARRLLMHYILSSYNGEAAQRHYPVRTVFPGADYLEVRIITFSKCGFYFLLLKNRIS